MGRTPTFCSSILGSCAMIVDVSSILGLDKICGTVGLRAYLLDVVVTASAVLQELC
jgi:hypothetical protein